MPATALKDATISGVRWTMMARFFREGLALGVTVVLARLLAPVDFGQAAVALSLVPLATILTFEGFASALVQRDAVDDDHRAGAALLSVVSGVLLMAVVAALAKPVGGHFFGPGTGDLLLMASPLFAISSLGAVPRALIWRGLDFRRINLSDVVGLVVSSAVSVGLAVAGAGPASLVVGALAQAAATSALLLRWEPLPRPAWRAGAQRDLVGFGVPAALAGLVHVAFTNVDYIIVAARLTATQAGLYWRAFQLGAVYQDKLSSVMMQLAFPIYSRTENREELGRLHQRAARVHAAVIFPFLVLLMVLAPTLVPWAFGDAWEPAVGPTQILAGAGMASAVLAGYPQVMLALGEPKALLRFNAVKLVLYGVVVWFAVARGLTVLAVVVTILYVLVVVAAYRFMLGPRLGIRMTHIAVELGPALAGCAGAAAVTVPLTGVLEGRVPAPLLIAGVGLVGLAVHCAVLRLLFAAVWLDLSTLAARVLPVRRSARPAPAAVAKAGTA